MMIKQTVTAALHTRNLRPVDGSPIRPHHCLTEEAAKVLLAAMGRGDLDAEGRVWTFTWSPIQLVWVLDAADYPDLVRRTISFQ